MNPTQRKIQNLCTALCSSTLLFGLLSLESAPLFAKTAASVTSATSRLEREAAPVMARLNFRVKGVKASRKKTFGIARGACQADEENLVALLPQASTAPSGPSPDNLIPVEPTTEAYPTFFVHIPTTSAQEADLLIQNADRTEILYETTFALTDEVGVVGVQLPPEAAEPLQVGNQYYWSVSLLCPTGSVAGGAFVEGWIERVDANTVLPSPSGSSPLALLDAYASAGLWQDTLATLAELRYSGSDSPDLQATWSDLLRSVGLEEIDEAPIVQIVK